MPQKEIKTIAKTTSVNSSYKRIVNLFVVATIILLGVILYFSLAEAKIYLKIKNQPAKINFTTQVKENVENDNYLETNVLDGRILELVVEKTRDFTVPGKESPAERYGGMMIIYNKKSENQSLVNKTRFESASGHIFRIQEAVNIPAGGSIEAYVVAEEIGEDYKELPGRFILPGFKNEFSRSRVYGELKEPMEKKSITSYVVSQEILNNANNEIVAGLKKDALHKLKNLLVDDEELDETSIITEIISYESSKDVGDEAKNFEYTVKLKVIGIVFDRAELLNLAQSFIDDQLSNTQELIDYNNDSLKYSINNYVTEEKNATLDVELSAHVIQSSESEIFDKERLKNLTQEEIIEYFSQQPAIESVKVVFSPFWVKKAPQMSNHINLIINKNKD
jgi:hypothetical protein